MTGDRGRATAFFSTEAERWAGLYASKPEFRDRFSLFVGGVRRITSPPATVLDFGCGAGVMSLALANEGYSVHGVDGSEMMIEAARRRQVELGVRNARFECVEAGKANLENAGYDAALCSSVLEYLADDRAALRALARALKPGGLLLISVPHSGSIFGKMEDLLKKGAWYRHRQGRQFLNYSLRRYNPAAFLGLLEAAGFGAFELTYFESPLSRFRWGARFSRCRRLGMLLLVAGRKVGAASW